MSLSSGIRVEWIAAVTIAAGTAAIGYLAYKRFYVKDHRNKSMVNLHIQKDNPKIVHAFDMEDLGDKAVYCRCWRSKKVSLETPHVPEVPEVITGVPTPTFTSQYTKDL
uniref:Iron-binding zinc finger CDGSH type domain-containing protein n=1 Tax=Suricata suricatta TaxID=37032 RepID=A0A673UFC1_SURSU